MNKASILVLWSILSTALAISQIAAAADYYVDPDYAGATKNGSASNPWARLGSSEWAVLNNALAASDVTVYFSAREAYSDTDQDYNKANASWDGVLRLYRKDNSSHWLAFDGNSRYNTDDLSPQWVEYSGSSRCHLHGASHGVAGFSQDGLQNYTKIKGFRISYHGTSGSRFGIYYFGGSHVVIENNIINPGGLYFEYANYHDQTHGRNGGCEGIRIIGNAISNPMGEGLYFGGGGNTTLNGHRDVLIEGNTVFSCGTEGGQGDGIDIKDNNQNVAVRNNTAYANLADGIVSMSPGIYEGNLAYGNGGNGIHLDTYWGLAWQNETKVANNVAYGNAGRGIGIWASYSPITGTLSFLSNTLCNNSGNLMLSIGKPVNSVAIRNIATSLSYNSRQECSISIWGEGSLNLAEDHNDFNGTVSGFTPSSTDINSYPGFASPETGDFHLSPDSPCIDKGAALSEFSYDKDGTIRPQGLAWDIGAYEYAGESCIHKSDINCDGCVGMSELTSFIDRWKVSNVDVTIKELIEAITLWKGGC